MDTLTTLQELIETGETLVPKGGNLFDGYNGALQPEYVSWRLQAISLFEQLGQSGKPILKDLEADENGAYFLQSSAQRVLGGLRAAAAIAKKNLSEEKRMVSTSDRQVTSNKHKVFIVHGHDVALLNQVARFLEKLNLEPIILFEQPGKGKTIIEKLETNSDTGFAIVLLTPDDLGKRANDPGDTQPRARQNVVFELGYFIGKLNRSNVVALYHESVELPSDYRGIEYIKIDVESGWKLKLAKEMKAAGLDIDMNNAI
jgi:predicted nucleotide-binding protein